MPSIELTRRGAIQFAGCLFAGGLINKFLPAYYEFFNPSNQPIDIDSRNIQAAPDYEPDESLPTLSDYNFLRAIRRVHGSKMLEKKDLQAVIFSHDNKPPILFLDKDSIILWNIPVFDITPQDHFFITDPHGMSKYATDHDNIPPDHIALMSGERLTGVIDTGDYRRIVLRAYGGDRYHLPTDYIFLYYKPGKKKNTFDTYNTDYQPQNGNIIAENLDKDKGIKLLRQTRKKPQNAENLLNQVGSGEWIVSIPGYKFVLLRNDVNRYLVNGWIIGDLFEYIKTYDYYPKSSSDME